jgi:hypothetical protein
MGTCPDSIKRLIERFDQQRDQVRSPDYNETQLRIDFVNPLFAALGWDIDNRLGNAEQYREVVHEDIRVSTDPSATTGRAKLWRFSMAGEFDCPSAMFNFQVGEREPSNAQRRARKTPHLHRPGI